MAATFVTVRGGILLPAPPPPFQATPAFTALVTINDGTDSAVWIFRVPKTGNTKAIGFLITTLTTAEDLLVSFQDVSATTGGPDGVADQSVVIASASLVAGWNTSGTITRAVTRGDLLACVVKANSASPNLVVSVPQYYSTGDPIEFPYAASLTPGLTIAARCGAFSLQYDDDSYEPIDGWVYPYLAFNAPTYNSGSTPDERGLKFQLPYTCKVDGGWAYCDLDGDAQFVLYDSDGTSVLTSVTLDKDQDANGGRHHFTFTSKITLTADTYYRLILKPTTTTNLGLRDFDVSTAALLDMCDLGQLAHYTERTDAGAWTDTTTKRPWMGIRISDVQTDPGVAASIFPVEITSPAILYPYRVSRY